MAWILLIALAAIAGFGLAALRAERREQELRANPAPRVAYAQLLPGGSSDSPEHEANSLIGENGLLGLGGSRAAGEGQVDRGVRIVRERGNPTPKATFWVASDPDTDIAGVRESAYPDLGVRLLDEHPGYELMRQLRPPVALDGDEATAASPAAAFAALPLPVRLAVAAGAAVALVLAVVLLGSAH